MSNKERPNLNLIKTLEEAQKYINQGFREDLCLRNLIKDLGWTEELSSGDKEYNRFELPHDCIAFKKGDKSVWGWEGWRCVDLKGNGWSETVRYSTPRVYKTLWECIQKES